MIRFRYSGDVEAAKRLVHFARKQMVILKDSMKFQNLWSDVRRYFNAETGVKIVCNSISGQDSVDIFVPEVIEGVKKERFFEEIELGVHRFALFAVGTNGIGTFYAELYMLYDIDNEVTIVDNATREEVIEVVHTLFGCEDSDFTIPNMGLCPQGDLVYLGDVRGTHFSSIAVGGGTQGHGGCWLYATGGCIEVKSYNPPAHNLSTSGGYVPRLNFMWSFNASESDSFYWTNIIVNGGGAVDNYTHTVTHSCYTAGISGYEVCDPPVAFQVYCTKIGVQCHPDGDDYPCHVCTRGEVKSEESLRQNMYFQPVTSVRLYDNNGNVDYIGSIRSMSRNSGHVALEGQVPPCTKRHTRSSGQTDSIHSYCPMGDFFSDTLYPTGTCEVVADSYGGTVIEVSGQPKINYNQYSSLGKSKFLATNKGAKHYSHGVLINDDKSDVNVTIYFAQRSWRYNTFEGAASYIQCAHNVDPTYGEREFVVKASLLDDLEDAEGHNPFGDTDDFLSGKLSSLVDSYYSNYDLRAMNSNLDIDVCLFSL